VTYGIRLLNFDPLAAFISPALNLNRDQTSGLRWDHLPKLLSLLAARQC
jgi:hypothetical protein